MKSIFTIIGLLSMASTSYAVQCTAQRLQTGKAPVNILLKENAIYAGNNPGKTQLNEADKSFPYGLSITTSSSNQDVTVIIRDKKHLYSSAGASGALDSRGKFQQGITLNSADHSQDLIDITCR